MNTEDNLQQEVAENNEKMIAEHTENVREILASLSEDSGLSPQVLAKVIGFWIYGRQACVKNGIESGLIQEPKAFENLAFLLMNDFSSFTRILNEFEDSKESSEQSLPS